MTNRITVTNNTNKNIGRGVYEHILNK